MSVIHQTISESYEVAAMSLSQTLIQPSNNIYVVVDLIGHAIKYILVRTEFNFVIPRRKVYWTNTWLHINE